MEKTKTKVKTFSTKTDGTWLDADILGHCVTGHWHWHEAKEKLLSELDKWKGTISLRHIISTVFHKHTGESMTEGAALELEVIYEEIIE